MTKRTVSKKKTATKPSHEPAGKQANPVPATAPKPAKPPEELRADGERIRFPNMSVAEAALLTDTLRGEGSQMIPPAPKPAEAPIKDPVNLWGYCDEGNRRIATALVGLQEIRNDILPWLRRCHEQGTPGAGDLSATAFALNHDWLDDTVDKAIRGCIEALGDFAALHEEIRELSYPQVAEVTP